MESDIVETLKERLSGCGCTAGQFGEPCGGCRHDAATLAEIQRLRRDLEAMTEEHRAVCLDRDGYLAGNKMLLKALREANETADKYRAEVRRLEADHG